MARILLTDGDQRATLAGVRSLGRAGHEVFVSADRLRSLAGVSKYCKRAIVTPSPLLDAHGFVDALVRVVQEQRIDVLLPITEAALLAVLAEPERFSGVRLPFPDLMRFQNISDKAAVLEAARKVGIAVPAQQVLRHPGDELSVSTPLVVKPTRSVIDHSVGRTKTAASYAADMVQLETTLSELPPSAYPILLQERITGPGIGVFVLLWEQRVVASFGHRRLREKPPWGGVSVYRESAEVPPQLLEAATELLRAFDWCGVAMVEFKVDQASGKPYLMEVNGRFWGSLQLAIDAGVDFPVLLVDAALGHPASEPPPFRAHVRSRWWWGDVDHLLARLRHSKAKLNLPADAPGRGRALLDFLSASESHNEVFRFDDLAPAMQETWDWVRRR